MKKLFFLFIILFITGCTQNKEYIDTIVVENNDFLVNINYPVTGTKLDFTIRNDIEKIYKEYNNGELNIDYLYYKNNNLISVCLFIYFNNGTIKKNNVKTYFYDGKLSKIDNFIDINKLNKIIIDEIKNTSLDIILSNNYEFSFDDNFLYIYFNKIDSYTYISIPLYKLNIFFKKNVDVFNNIILPKNDIDYNSKVIALTFDDGPSKYTNDIIEYLYKNDCKATFFVLGNKVSNYNEVLNKSIRYGNEIGNHSYNHKWLIKLKKNEFLEQINKTQDIIYKYTGYTPTLLRPTYGSVNSLIKENTDLKITLWNVDTLDWKYKNTNKIIDRATGNLKDGNIILMHDIYKRTYDSIKKIVPILKEKGYKCVTISELNKINAMRYLDE